MIPNSLFGIINLTRVKWRCALEVETSQKSCARLLLTDEGQGGLQPSALRTTPPLQNALYACWSSSSSSCSSCSVTSKATRASTSPRGPAVASWSRHRRPALKKPRVWTAAPDPNRSSHWFRVGGVTCVTTNPPETDRQSDRRTDRQREGNGLT
ncbi:unnamed protein product [Boreogadus saida]